MPIQRTVGNKIHRSLSVTWPGASAGPKMWGGHIWRACGARAYNGDLGAEPPAGSRSRAPGQGVRRAKPQWSWKTFTFWMPDGSSKFASFSEFCNLSYPQVFVIGHVCQTINSARLTDQRGSYAFSCNPFTFSRFDVRHLSPTSNRYFCILLIC